MALNRQSATREEYASEIPAPETPWGYGNARSNRQQSLTREREAILKRYPNFSVPVSDRYEQVQVLRNQLRNPLTGHPRTREYFEIKQRRARLALCKPENMLACLERLEKRVFILSSGTGSGKTTELPPLIVENMLLRDNRPLQRIVCTQPRRDTARNMCNYVSQALDTHPGDWVGYHVRHEKQTCEKTVIKYVTDGLLLEEVLHDRTALRSKYGYVIVDEAHERTTAIDQLVAILRAELRRPGSTLSVVIMSATMKADVFREYFRDFDPAVLNVDTQNAFAREIRWLNWDPPVSKMNEQIFNAVARCLRRQEDVLVFVPGEPDIDALTVQFQDPQNGLCAATRVAFRLMALFGNQRPEETHQVHVSRKGGRPRVILATNVAETGVTIPDLDAVIDSGYCKVASRNWDQHADVLQTRTVCKSSADQRAGRVGRMKDGTVYRLYDEEKYQGMADENPPDITQKRLSSDALRIYRALPGMHMNDMGLIDRVPEPASLEMDGELLHLGLMDKSRVLTPLGKDAASLGCDPRAGLMLLKAVHMSPDARRWAVCAAAALELREPSLVLKMSQHDPVVFDFENRQGEIKALGTVVSSELLRSGLTPHERPDPDRRRPQIWNPLVLSQLGTFARAFDKRLGELYDRMDVQSNLWRSGQNFDAQMGEIVSAGLRLQLAQATNKDDEYQDVATKRIVLLDKKSILYRPNVQTLKGAVAKHPDKRFRNDRDVQDALANMPEKHDYVWYFTKRELRWENRDSKFVISGLLQASVDDIKKCHPELQLQTSNVYAPAFAPPRRRT